MTFKDPDTPKKIASRKALWLALCVNHEVADMLVEDLQLEFDKDVLQVSSTCQDRGDAVEITVPPRRQWLWPRFAALGTSCRSFAPKSRRSHIIGVVLQDAWEETKNFMVQAAIVCRVERQRFAINILLENITYGKYFLCHEIRNIVTVAETEHVVKSTTANIVTDKPPAPLHATMLPSQSHQRPAGRDTHVQAHTDDFNV